MAVADQFDTVQKIYIAFYQRPADPAGLKFWAENIDAAGGDISAVINAFATSDEATSLYGEINEETIGTVIDSIYQALFGRAADTAGRDYYLSEFAAGNITAGNIALAVLAGAQGDDQDAIDNKVEVANEFTKQVDGREFTDTAFGTEPFNATYEGDTDAEAAREMLAGVTADDDTVLDAEEVTAFVRSQIADAGDPIGTASEVLLEKLQAYDAAVEAQNEAAVAYSEALVEAGLIAATDADENGIADAFEANPDADYVLEAEQDVLDARVALSDARNAPGQSDAALNQAVTTAQQAVNADTALYTAAGGAQVPGEPVYTAAQLQARATAAQNTLNANIAAGGETITLASQLEDAIALYLANDDEGSAALTTLADAINALQTAEETYQASAQDQAAQDAYDAALNTFYGAVITAHTAVFTDTDGDGEFTSELATGARGDAVEALLTQLDTRADLDVAADAAQAGFKATAVGTALVNAQDDVAEREGLIADVAEAQANLAAINEAAAAYEAATQAVEDAAEDLGYEINEIDAAGEFGTEDADLFLFDTENVEGIADIIINGLESDDLIYLGSDYTLGTAGSANNNALEVFLTEVNGNAVLQIENTPFGSASEDGFTEITLTGIAQADVTIENGVVFFA